MRHLILFILCLFTSAAFAEDDERGLVRRAWDYIKKDASITVGVGSRNLSLSVKDNSENVLGKFVESSEEAYFLSYSGRPTFLRNSHFGYRWMINLSTFVANEQEIAENQTQNLGTQTYGIFSYVVPSFFANFGDRHKGRYFRLGIGLGLGTSDVKGDIILNYSANPSQKISLENSNHFNVAVGVFAEARYSNFVARLNAGGPVIDMPPYTFQISDASFMLGYSFFLD